MHYTCTKGIFLQGEAVNTVGKTSNAFRLMTALFLWAATSCAPAAAQEKLKAAAPCWASDAKSQAHDYGQETTESSGFAAKVEAILGANPVSKGEWGILVEDAETGKVLYEQNADKYFVPASNMKLFTTALALAKLGPEYRFRTTLETAGSVSDDGKLTGDLILVGRGDPNLSNRKFPYVLKEEFDGGPEKVIAELADAIVAKGIKEITGDIVGDDSYFPRERYPEGWEIDDMVWEYGAAISAIIVDDNTVTLTLTPGEKLGDPVTGELSPAAPEFTVNAQVVTAAQGVKADLTLTRDPGSNVVNLIGTLPAKSNPRKLVLAIQEPALHAAAMLKRLLVERGVKVYGGARALHFPPGPPAGETRTVLAEHLSVPLGESLQLVNKISQNLHTEVLLRTAARQAGIWAKPEDLYKFPQDFYTAAGIAVDDVVQSDGSGLSRHDLVTPRAIAALLFYAEKQPWFSVYFSSLPVAGVDGTLENNLKNGPATGRLHAKTGSVEHVRSRSGYADLPNGRRLIFSFLSNNLAGKNHEAGDALDALSLAMIEEFDKPEPECCKGMKHSH